MVDTIHRSGIDTIIIISRVKGKPMCKARTDARKICIWAGVVYAMHTNKHMQCNCVSKPQVSLVTSECKSTNRNSVWEKN